ncbi:hypothetical protein M3P21_21025 [Ruegeria sp. 2012CJ41-6]|uniref:Uncharacterized protein n=1 Tax=Ruegeria spongiae TaxID=2942209 RepID=A0ABT0Q8V3_9RHOB|nr:hypothetical protein [Ruegeria spongiae]MCL6286002.1 hypothetical protein [Ruegeria spongiae]
MTNSTSPNAVLGLIRGAETTKGYEDFYSKSVIAPPKPVTQMTVSEVREWQRRSVNAGSKSSAIGGYQIISKTFNGLVSDLGLTGDEVFDIELQDRMGMHLMARRGYNDWVTGKITDNQFANNLSKEWAGLPMVSGRKSGRSYYAGDGLNGATVTPGNVFEALNAARTGGPFEFQRSQGTTAGGPRPAPSAYQASLEGIVPMETFEQRAIDAVENTPVSTFRSKAQELGFEQQAAAETPSWWDATKMAANEEWIGLNVAEQMGRKEFTPDASFRLTDDMWKEVTDDLDPVYHSGLEAATSEAHLRALSAQMQHEQKVDRDLSGLGWGGTGLRVGAAILDPAAIVASVATEGAAAPLIYSAKIGRVGRALRAGAAAGAVNAGIDGYLATQDQTMGWDDVAISAAAGFVLGGAVGGLRGRTPEDKAMAAAIQDAEGDNIARAFSGGTADGSVGAARVPQDPNLSAAETVAAESASAPVTAFSSARIDRSAVLKSSESDVMRRVGAGLIEDGVGNADGSVNRFSVSEKVAREERVRTGRFYRTYNNAYRDWLKDQGKRMFWQHGAGERAEFNKQVSLAVRREIDAVSNKHVNAVASQMKKEFADLLEFGKQYGIRGFDEVKANHNYMVRRHRIDRIDDLVSEFGEGSINRLVARSIQKANRKWRNRNPGRAMAMDEIDYEDALSIAASYVKSIRSRRYGEFNLNRALAGQDIETLKMMLDDAGMSAEDVTRISDKVRFSVDSGEQGRMASAKWRLDIDETHREKLYSKSGVAREVSIEDMLENDAEQLFGQYVRSVTAAGHMEDFLKEFRVRDAEGNLPAHAPSFDTVKSYIAKEAGEKGMSAKQVNKEMRVLDNAHKLINGIPIEGASSFRTAQRFLRDFNFSRIGGQLGVAQMAELGNIVGNGGMRVLMQNIPAMRKIFANAKTGKFSDDFLNEIESIWGFGTDLERMNMAPMFDEMGAVEHATSMQKADHFLQRSKKVTVLGSGMGHVNMVPQRLNARVLVQRFMDDATGRRDINPKRLRVMGISEELHPRIQEQLRKHVDQSTGMLGKKVNRVNIHKWDDVDAKNAFINGVDRWAKKSIQENDIGNMPDFMSKEAGKTIAQFRSFMLAAYVKQTLSGLHHRDWETASAFLTTMFFGGLFYVGQTHVNSLGREDRDEYLKDRLAPESLGKAAFQRSGFSSVVPLAADMVATTAGLDPVFDFRSSGLKSGGVSPADLLISNPTGDLTEGVTRGIGGAVQGALNSDYQFSEKDFKALTKISLFQNMFGIRNVLAAIGGTMPEYSR